MGDVIVKLAVRAIFLSTEGPRDRAEFQMSRGSGQLSSNVTGLRHTHFDHFCRCKFKQGAINCWSSWTGAWSNMADLKKKAEPLKFVHRIAKHAAETIPMLLLVRESWGQVQLAYREDRLLASGQMSPANAKPPQGDNTLWLLPGPPRSVSAVLT